MTKERLSVSLDSHVMRLLKEAADKEKRSLSSQAAIFIEKSLPTSKSEKQKSG